MSTRHLNQVELARRWRMSERTLERWRWLKHNTVHLGQNSVHLSFMAGLNTLKIRLFAKFW